MSKDDQEDDEDPRVVKIAVDTVFRAPENDDDVILVEFDIGRGDEDFCLFEFVDYEGNRYAIATTEVEFDDKEASEWELYLFLYAVCNDGELELSPVEDVELGKRVLAELERKCLQANIDDPETNPFDPEAAEA